MADSTSDTSSSSSSTTNIASTLSSAKETYDETAKKPSIFLASVRTYVAGILMPTIAITISCSFDKSPTATITLPADPRLFNVGSHDRVPVMVFVKETVVESPNYVLMFEGFVTSRTYMSVVTQREVNLQCASYTEMFNDAKLRFLTSCDEWAMAQVPGNSGISQSDIFVPDFEFPLVLFTMGLGLQTEENDKQKEFIDCPTSYLSNLIQYVEESGTGYAAAGRFNDSIVSKYYATLAYNLHYDRRFCWLPYFDYEVKASGDDPTACWKAEEPPIEEQKGDKGTMFPVLYGLKTDAMQKAIVGALQTCSKEFSLAEYLRFLVESMEYEFLVIPNPAFQAKSAGDDEGLKADEGRDKTLEKYVDENGDIKGEGVTSTSPVKQEHDSVGDEKYKEGVKNLQRKYERKRNCDRMVNFLLKPLFDDTFPPKCNIIFRSQVLQLSTTTEYNQTPTRIQVKNFCTFGEQIANMGGSENALALYGSVDFYPSENFSKKKEEVYGSPDHQVNNENGDMALLSNTIYKSERWTGPWMVQNSAPGWMTYAFQGEDGSADEDRQKAQIHMRESYMRRQLMRAQITSRTLSADCVFLPYVTCGFPCVIYDSTDTGFSFAGNVQAYEHQISAAGMNTSVVINGVRLLAEAVLAEKNGMFPNPINCVHAITHNESALKNVYAAILGTPGATVSGAEPMTWESVKSTYSGIIENVTQSPQTNIYEAYKLQRRNIITFDDYCTFMGLTKDPTGTDEDGNPPTSITNEWVNDRADIDVYQVVPLLQNVRPVEKLKKDLEKKKKELEEEEEELKKEKEALDEEEKKVDALDAASDKTLSDAGMKAVDSGDGKTDNIVGYDENDPAKVQALKNYEKQVDEYNKAVDKYNQHLEEYEKKEEAHEKKAEEYVKDQETAEKDEKKDKERLQQFNSDGKATKVQDILKEVAEECRGNNIY